MGEIIRLERDPAKLQAEEFDLVIAGAGIFGACAAWEASLRGFKVALIDKNDFGSGVSANSFKMVHGGIRYIQHLDIPRVRRSCHDRSVLLKIAPHLVHPIPIIIPTYGYGMSGKPVLSAGMYLYDLMTIDRNINIHDASRKIPWTQLMGKSEVLGHFPGLESRRLTGATQFSDAQMYNPPRLVLAFIQSAVGRGACVCNYARVSGYRVSQNKVESVQVVDELTGDTFDVRAKMYLNATGPWTDRLLDQEPGIPRDNPGIYSRDACFAVPRRFDHDLSLAVLGQTHDPDAFMSRPARHLFVVPWRDYSLIGVWHKIVDPTPDSIGISRDEIEDFIDEVHGTYPDLELSAGQVSMCNWGLVPFGEEQTSQENLSYGKRSIIVDHAKIGGPANMISLIGVRYTVGRSDARRAIGAIASKLGDDRTAPESDHIPVYGGEIDDFESLVRDLKKQVPEEFEDKVVRSLAHNHGARASDLVASSRPEALRQIDGSHVLVAEIEHAIRNEMAKTLSDVVFRRTDLATGGSPGENCLKECASVAGELLNISDREIDRQLTDVVSRIPGWE